MARSTSSRRDGRALHALRRWARTVERDVHALVVASGDVRVPRLAKIVAIGVAAYALSPIDLIPDAIPLIGYLDDALIVPLGILLAVKLVPPDLMTEFRARVASAEGERALGRLGAAVIAFLWIAGALATARLLWSWTRH